MVKHVAKQNTLLSLVIETLRSEILRDSLLC